MKRAKKLVAWLMTVMLLTGVMATGVSGATAEPLQEVFASKFFSGVFGYDWYAEAWYDTVWDEGSLSGGVLDEPTVTDSSAPCIGNGTWGLRVRNTPCYRYGDVLVFTFDQPVIISSMTFVCAEDGEFPTDFSIGHRRPDYWSEDYQFVGNPTEETLANASSNWPIAEGFDGKDFEVTRDGNIVTIRLTEPVACVALSITALEDGETPWSCTEAHFYGSLQASYTGQVYANRFYHTAASEIAEDAENPTLPVTTYGDVRQGVLARQTITNLAAVHGDVVGCYGDGDSMVFTFDRPTTLSGLKLVSLEDGQLPTSYRIYTRDIDYTNEQWAENDGALGSPGHIDIVSGKNWPIVEGFSPDEGLAYEEISREGDTVVIQLAEPVLCGAVMIVAEGDGETPWSCAEARFYGDAYGVMRGDVNGDQTTNALDATRILLGSVGKVELHALEQTAAEVNGDGVTNAMDATLVLLHSVGKRLIDQ